MIKLIRKMIKLEKFYVNIKSVAKNAKWNYEKIYKNIKKWSLAIKKLYQNQIDNYYLSYNQLITREVISFKVL